MRSQQAPRQNPRHYPKDGQFTQEDLMRFMAADPEIVNTTDQVRRNSEGEVRV